MLPAGFVQPLGLLRREPLSLRTPACSNKKRVALCRGTLAVLHRDTHDLVARDVWVHAASASSLRYASPAKLESDSDPPAAARLLNRQLEVNPIHTLTKLLESQLQGLDLAMAVHIDRNPLVSGAVLALGALMLVKGLHPLQQLLVGLPEALADSLYSVGGEVLEPVLRAGVFALTLGPALCHLRTWWAASLALWRPDSRAPASAVVNSSPPPTFSSSNSPGTSSSTLPTAADAPLPSEAKPDALASRLAALYRRALAMVSDHPKPNDRTWVYAILACRLVALSMAVKALLCGAAASAPAFAGMCFAASLLPAAVPQLWAMVGAGRVIALGLPLLLSDAAFLVAVAPQLALNVRAAAAVAWACATTMVGAAATASGRLRPCQLLAGDSATVHVTLRQGDAEIDTTRGHRPLRITLAAELPEAVAGSTVGTSDAAAVVVKLAQQHLGLGPQERFDPLRNLLLEELPGRYLGEKASVAFFNPRPDEGGYQNPQLSWWQPTEDVQKKFKRLPDRGDVFMYPLPEGKGVVPVLIQAVNSQFVHMDGNFGVRDAKLVAELEVVEVIKAAA